MSNHDHDDATPINDRPDPFPVRGTSKVDGSFYCSSNANHCTKGFTPASYATLSLVRRLDGALHIAVRIHVRFHDLVKIGLVDHGAGLGTFGFLLQILAQEV